MRALVVEDDSNNRKLLEVILSRYGDVQSAENGAAGLSLFNAAVASNKPFDVVLLDIMMPGMDGREVLRRLRETEASHEIYLEGASKVIMLTAVAEKDVVINAFRDGCDAYLVKPLQPEELNHQLRVMRLVDPALLAVEEEPNS